MHTSSIPSPCCPALRPRPRRCPWRPGPLHRRPKEACSPSSQESPGRAGGSATALACSPWAASRRKPSPTWSARARATAFQPAAATRPAASPCVGPSSSACCADRAAAPSPALMSARLLASKTRSRSDGWLTTASTAAIRVGEEYCPLSTKLMAAVSAASCPSACGRFVLALLPAVGRPVPEHQLFHSVRRCC